MAEGIGIRRAWPLLFLLTGCGYVGDPLPPLANVPGAIHDLSAVQRGSRLIVHFTPPAETTEHMPVPGPLRLDLRIGTAVSPFSADAWAAQAQPIREAPVKKGVAEYELPATEWAGKEVTIGARAIASNRKESGWSNFVNLRVVPAPERPSAVHPEATAEGVRLTWQGGPGQYRVFRRDEDAKEFTLLQTVEGAQYLDRTAETGKLYAYEVQRIVAAGDHVAESELSEIATITPKDTFPPAAPTGLRAVAATQSIELTWERNGEEDLAGYRIYRATGDGAFERIGETSVVPAYSDRAVETGKTYRYQISAFDRAGNESARSAAVSAGI